MTLVTTNNLAVSFNTSHAEVLRILGKTQVEPKKMVITKGQTRRLWDPAVATAAMEAYYASRDQLRAEAEERSAAEALRQQAKRPAPEHVEVEGAASGPNAPNDDVQYRLEQLGRRIDTLTALVEKLTSSLSPALDD